MSWRWVAGFQKCSLTHLPFPLPWVSLATNYTRYPPKSPHTPPLKFMCHLLITELVNVSPPAPLLLSSQYSAALLCQQFSSSPSSSCSLIISPLFSSAVSFPQLWADDYSNKQRLSLQITTLIQTPVLPLLLSVVVDYCTVLQRLSRAFVCLSVTWWPCRDPQARSRWRYSGLPRKSWSPVVQVCAFVYK